ncbi:hypothetical protein, partial [Olivibacter sp. XZL3]|uniref:hypothetical protein n=1 Tax=Olivibacter sp. XZL3 TaxID=1735116 RepID=UPI00197F1E04
KKQRCTGGAARRMQRRPKRERRRLKFFKKSDSCSVTDRLLSGANRKDRMCPKAGRYRKDRKAALERVQRPRSKT